MKKVPTMISTKDLMYISDMFNWHLIAAKKTEEFAKSMDDKECHSKLSELCRLHYDSCEMLIKLLESGVKE